MADLGNTMNAKRPENQKEWMSATATSRNNAKDRTKQVQQALKDLEQKEADRMAALRAEKHRQELEAQAAEKKKKEEAQALKERQRKEKAAEELRLIQEALKGAKKAEASAVLAAAASASRGKQEESDAREKSIVTKSLTHSSQQVLKVVLDTKIMTSKLYGITVLCEERQKIREGRPESELFNDAVQQALEKERQTLIASREDMNALYSKAELMRSNLEMLLMQLNTGVSRERAMKKMMKSSNSLPELGAPGSPQNSGQEVGAAVVMPTSKELVKKGFALLEEAAQLPKQGARSLAHVDAQCESANAATLASLDRRKAELGELIKGLQAQRAEAEGTASEAESRITKLKRRLQGAQTTESSKAFEDQIVAAEALLPDLKALVLTLETDIRNKYHALKIDESCRALTKSTLPVKAPPGLAGSRPESNSTRGKAAWDGSFPPIPAATPAAVQEPAPAA